MGPTRPHQEGHGQEGKLKGLLNRCVCILDPVIIGWDTGEEPDLHVHRVGELVIVQIPRGDGLDRFRYVTFYFIHDYFLRFLDKKYPNATIEIAPMANGGFPLKITSKVITESTFAGDQKMQAIATRATNRVTLLMDFLVNG
jgi:hypothetical protein